ncbi:MAG TPA: PTS sugar transporter subunit IIA, partial [bacterium]|nr:PTS sugar transporter subunit IIA [bacterium]
MKLSDYLDANSIRLDLQATSKEQVLNELVNMLAASGRIHNKEALLEALLEREGLGSTGIGHGVAIPHGRSPELEKATLVLGRTKANVDFDSIDGQPARLFFLLVAPENGSNEHLHLLSRIAKLMRDSQTREHLLQATTPQQVAEEIQRS